MKHLIEHAQPVADAFFNLTASIRSQSSLDTKVNELVLIGIFTAARSHKGIITHLQRAIEAGASEEDIRSAIILALPVCGIGAVNQALDVAMEHLSSSAQKEHAAR